ncbi:ATP-binding cassette domain-containing protein [Peribacillus frigoritolerans]|uniref:AAA family ATPase n=1 Tax=Peribacillus frigoritolerans TaxID=450367 RepID=UPI001059DE11|nr:AAA family ATPase [Peribacillus frigoritolerans]TDL80209.1 ATP-binding cassette domain-containing protein [Peribacillus frigoritolerans]
MHLKRVSFIPDHKKQEYPYGLPLFKESLTLSFEAQVTILAGENGTGKTTLLEAIAEQSGLIRIASAEDDDINEEIRKFSRELKLSWSAKTKKGFYLKADDFLTYARNVSRMRAEAEKRLEEVEEEYRGKSILARQLAASPYHKTIGEIEELYGRGLDNQSHGERFLSFFQTRFRSNGFYLLDEPEGPLSPMKQLSLISMLLEMIKEGSQFIIATHSPILMAFPDAVIYSLDDLPLKSVQYDDLEHVKITKGFLNSPERYLKHL